jgi:hypothetical protein
MESGGAEGAMRLASWSLDPRWATKGNGGTAPDPLIGPARTAGADIEERRVDLARVKDGGPNAAATILPEEVNSPIPAT